MSALRKHKVAEDQRAARFRAKIQGLLDTPEARAEGLAIDFVFAIAKQRDKLGLTDSEIARRMGVSRQRVSRIMTGTQNSTLGSLARMAEAVGLDLGLKLAPRKAR